jgi:endonuclease/exonuclease/phosphatase family metal-dependent hydrolase
MRSWRLWFPGLLALAVNQAASAGLSVLTYNTKGNNVADWSTNSPQVQAIGRQMQALDPDIISFQEIPYTETWQMTNFVKAFRPGYALATNSGTDGYIRSVILSRYPILRSTSWLDGVDLKPFGYTNANPNLDNFTRDLFEAEVAVPGFALPVHLFTTHLKAGTDSESLARRAAEASAISNFFVAGFLTTNSQRVYVLTGDMNEDIAVPPSGSGQPVQRLTSAPTGLKLTTPVNPFTRSEKTWSIQGSLGRRYDYILPGGWLFSNILSSQVFRTDLGTSPFPALSGDSAQASDHLPVLMTFANPYDVPFRILSVSASNALATLTWESVTGQGFVLEGAVQPGDWSVVASNLTATGTTLQHSLSITSGHQLLRVRRVK